MFACKVEIHKLFHKIWDGQKSNRSLLYLYPFGKCFSYTEDLLLIL